MRITYHELLAGLRPARAEVDLSSIPQKFLHLPVTLTELTTVSWTTDRPRHVRIAEATVVSEAPQLVAVISEHPDEDSVRQLTKSHGISVLRTQISSGRLLPETTYRVSLLAWDNASLQYVPCGDLPAFRTPGLSGHFKEHPAHHDDGRFVRALYEIDEAGGDVSFVGDPTRKLETKNLERSPDDPLWQRLINAGVLRA